MKSQTTEKPAACIARAALLSLVITALWFMEAPRADETWLLVNTGEQTLTIMRGDERVLEFSNISIGRNGASRHKLVGDLRTPLGQFQVSSIKQESRFHRFIGIDYPDLQYAIKAFEAGEIDAQDLEAIQTAHEQGVPPPASTPLGGHIGIHGFGAGDPGIHEDFNWTEGCVALTNGEVDELLKWVRLQMVVLIL
jgi:murein L,D-transpeptidase YafK